MSMSKITRQQKIHLLDVLVAAHDAVNAQFDALNGTLRPDPGCPLYNAVFELLNVAIASTAAATGDIGEWIDWFVNENDCGRKGYEAGHSDNLRPVRTVDDLLDLIEQGGGMTMLKFTPEEVGYIESALTSLAKERTELRNKLDILAWWIECLESVA